MGCFNTVRVPCPNCGTVYEFQSKMGSCTQRTRLPGVSEPEDVVSLNGTVFACQKCHYIATLRVKARLDFEEDDLL